MTSYTTETKADVKTLIAMLQTRRPAGSKTERKFIQTHLMPLGLDVDRKGNLSKRIGIAPVLWSCHTDTVHKQGGTQRIAIAGKKLSLFAKSDSNCLGADDSAGIWLMREMILAQRPGLYVFHRCEEIGGIGSRYIADSTPDFLEGIDYAIALDRRGNDDVITHQSWGRCCSDNFALKLSEKLGNGYKPDDSGIFTDTANYVDLIPECTNISVGYQGEHSKLESLDLGHLLTLRDSLVALDTTGLPVERDPTVIDYSFGSYGEPMEMQDSWSSVFDRESQKPQRDSKVALDMVTMIKDNPEIVASILDEYGIGSVELADEIYQLGGYVRF